MSISVVIPMLNERESIPLTVEKLSNFLNSLHLDYEIIIVDDGSTDGSSRIIDELCEVYSFLRVIHFSRNAGIGRALRVGFNSAKKDIILYTDSDLPVAMSKVREAIGLMEKNNVDIVVGYRKGKRESVYRLIYSSIYNLIIRGIFKIDLKDINCAMKIFRRKIIKDIELNSDGPFIDAELLIQVVNNNFRVMELEIDCVPRKEGSSKFASPQNLVKTIFKIISELIVFYVRMNRLRLKNEKLDY